MLKIKAALSAIILFAIVSVAAAQTIPAKTYPMPVSIATGNTYQLVLAAVTSSASNQRRSITIQNNNTSDSCYLTVGGANVAGNTTATNITNNSVTSAASKQSILLASGQSYTRYFPDIPNDLILGTCASNGDSLYVDVQ